MSEWIRARFHANMDDPRPIKWPPIGPYWVSGEGPDYSIVIAYVKHSEQVMEFWPEAAEVDESPAESLVFTDRFPKPKWWTPDEINLPAPPETK